MWLIACRKISYVQIDPEITSDSMSKLSYSDSWYGYVLHVQGCDRKQAYNEKKNRIFKSEPNGASKDEKCGIWN